jgi:acetyl coenzyme A synthetase (ADP forming)-like protein
VDERNVPLPDGTTVRVRRITSDDRQRMLAMWDRTGEASRRARFHGTFKLGEHNVDRFTDLDPDTQFALVATLGRGDDERIVAVARYERDGIGSSDAEFAALVEDGQQGRGIGTALVRLLAMYAKDDGITQLTGDILSDNARMLRLVQDLGLAADSSGGGSGSVRTDLELEFGDEFLRVVDEDDARAARAAVGRFLEPERVAVVGASRDGGSIGGLVFRNLLDGGFSGVVYPVNNGAAHVRGVTAYPDLASCPEPPDLVIVCVPASEVPGVVDQAGELGVRAVCVITAGFAEVGAGGRSAQDDLLEAAHSHGLRLVGPNCMGVLNADAAFRLNGTFSRTFPPPGRIAMSSQSGALGLAVLEHVDRLGLGMSSFLSIGNKADISGNDLLLYWETDEATDVVLLYLESFGNPRKFSRIARRLSRRKPIVAVKSGRTRAGERAATSHTAALASGEVATTALFAQTGVIRVDTLQEMLDVATVLTSQPLPAGPRVAVLTNAGGPGILAADACESNGLVVPQLSDETRARLAEVLPANATTGNPVDLTAAATPAAYRAGMEVLGDDPDVDIVLVIFIPTRGGGDDGLAEVLAATRHDLRDDLQVVSVFMSEQGVTDELRAARIPSFAFPEDAARALGRVQRHAAWRRRPLGRVVRPTDMREDVARRVVEAALTGPRVDGQPTVGSSHAEGLVDARPDTDRATRDLWLSQIEAEAVLDAYGVSLARSRLVSDRAEIERAVAQLGTPVAVKVASPVHKTDIGGVVLDLRSADEAVEAVERLRERMLAAGHPEHADRFLVQEMVRDGIEMVVGVVQDPLFGPLVMTGMGGTLVELVEDVQVRVTPLTDVDVDDMLDGLRMRPLLDGYRGAPAADVDALRDLLHRIGALVEDLPEVVEVDCNPVFVRPGDGGVVAVDVRVRVAG